jgi:hypothetical protein
MRAVSLGQHATVIERAVAEHAALVLVDTTAFAISC